MPDDTTASDPFTPSTPDGANISHQTIGPTPGTPSDPNPAAPPTFTQLATYAGIGVGIGLVLYFLTR